MILQTMLSSKYLFWVKSDKFKAQPYSNRCSQAARAGVLVQARSLTSSASWASYLTSLHFSFLMKMGTIM